MMDQELFARFLRGEESTLDDLLKRHLFRLERLVKDRGADGAELLRKISTSLIEHRRQLQPAPDFLHWLFLFTLRELRFNQTGYAGFDGLFETPEEEFHPSRNFAHELNRFLEWMTDEKMEHYRMRFEDGLVFEEMAAHLQKMKPGSAHPTPWPSWLEDWKKFSQP